VSSSLRQRISSTGVLIVMLLAVGCQARIPATRIPIPVTVEEVPRINPHELKAVLDAGEAVSVVDTRTREQFEQRHIAGAISVPSDEVEERYGELPRAEDIVFY
jgi:3-mercaptopyruvate sulfurtransferase SseA